MPSGDDIFGDVALGEALRFDHQRHFLRLRAKLDDVADVDAARGDVALHAVDADVAVADQLARGPDRRRELGAIDDHVEAALEQADQVLEASPFIRLACWKVCLNCFSVTSP